MSEPAATSPIDPTGHTGPTEKRWPAIYALVTAWVVPATTTRRTNHVRLVSAFCVHFIGLVLALCALLFVVALNQYALSIKDIPYLNLDISDINQFKSMALRSPGEALLNLLTIAAKIEGILLVLAFSLTPWSARVEPALDSLRHSLRRTWLHSGHAALFLLLPGMVTVYTDWYSRTWFATIPEPQPPTATATPDELAEYDEKMSDYFWARFDPDPLLVKYEDEIDHYFTIFVGVWVVWALLRGLSADRPVRTLKLPQLCRACGYSLTGLPLDGRCPECGRPVQDSIGPQASPGVPWEHAPTQGLVRAFHQTARSFARDPFVAGMQLSLTPRTGRHQLFLLINAVLCGFLFGAAVWLMVWLRFRFGGSGLHPSFLLAFEYGLSSAAVILLFASVLAMLPAAIYYDRDKRNILSGSFQAACYSSTWLVLITACSAFAMVLCELWRSETIVPFASAVGIPRSSVVTLILTTITIVGLVAYAVRVFRASAGVRYACR